MGLVRLTPQDRRLDEGAALAARRPSTACAAEHDLGARRRRRRRSSPTMRVADRRVMTGPTSVAGSRGSPSTSSARPARRCASTSVVGDARGGRSGATSTCSAGRTCRTRRRGRRRRRGRGRRRSSTIMAFLPPSSRETSFGPASIAAAATLRPVGTEPVKLTAPTPGCVASACPGSPWPCTTLQQAGRDAGLDEALDEAPRRTAAPARTA